MNETNDPAEMDLKIESVQDAIIRIRAERSTAKEALRRETRSLHQRYATAHKKFQRERTGSVEYAAALDNNMPPYVLRHQAKLCQVTHRMCLNEELLTMTKSQVTDQIRESQRDLERIRQEAPLQEIAILNEIHAEAERLDALHQKLQAARVDFQQLKADATDEAKVPDSIETTLEDDHITDCTDSASFDGSLSLSQVADDTEDDRPSNNSDNDDNDDDDDVLGGSESKHSTRSELKEQVETLARWFGDMAAVGYQKSVRGRLGIPIADGVPVKETKAAVTA